MKKNNFTILNKGSAKRVLAVFFLAVFSAQTSASASTEYFSLLSAVSDSHLIRPASEMHSISNRSFLNRAISPIESNSSEFFSSFETGANPVVGIYRYVNRYRKFTRLVFASKDPRSGYPYQAYEIDSAGQLGRLIETGKMNGKDFFRERIYDYKNKTVTLYKPDNVFEKRTYELTESGEPGRPFQFSGRTPSGDLVNIRFIYRGAVVTCVHLRGMSYSTYALTKQGSLGDLLEMGTARAIDYAGNLVVKTRIRISTIQRDKHEFPVYVYLDSKGGALVRERAEGAEGELGGIGRILRFTNQEVDYEYFYDDAAKGGVAEVKVLNHRLGQSFTFQIPKKDLVNPFGDFKNTPSSKQLDLAEAIASVILSFSKGFSGVSYIPSQKSFRSIYIRSNDEALIWEKLLRGPPAHASKILESFVSAVIKFISFCLFPPFLNNGVRL